MKIKIVNKSNNPLPAFQTSGSAGMDICAFLEEPLILHSNEQFMIPTGIYMAIEKGYECQVRTRSGMANKGLQVVNSPGTIDSDYRGECKVILINHSTKTHIINSGDRIAQLVFQKVEQPELEVVESLDETERGTGGFGSTGV